MKLIENSVLENSIYTGSLSRMVEDAQRRFVCHRAGEDVYIGVDFKFVARLSIMEYDALIRPVTQREAGDYAISCIPYDVGAESLMESLRGASAGQPHDLKITPFVLYERYERHDGSVQNPVHWRIATYYSQDGDFVVGVDEKYDSIIRSTVVRRSRGDLSPIVCYKQNFEPCARITPVKFDTLQARAIHSYCKEVSGGE